MDQPEKTEWLKLSIQQYPPPMKKFYEQKERVISLYSEYMPLLDRYDEPEDQDQTILG